MRCDELMRRLDGQSGRDAGALADHLAVCQECASKVQQAPCWQWLWEATRPCEPTAETWDGLWGSVTARLDQPDLAQRDRPWSRGATAGDAARRLGRARLADRGGSRRALLAVMILAQAAAVLLALGWHFHGRPGAPEVPQNLPASTETSALAPGLDRVIDIEEGQVPLVRSSGSNSEILDLSSLQPPSNGEDPWLVFLNDVESASTAVALTE
jgi:hypothetical protein